MSIYLQGIGSLLVIRISDGNMELVVHVYILAKF